MHIASVLTQHRRDMKVVFKCEHCGHVYRGSAYDDDYFHNVVVPGTECGTCGKKADETYTPRKPKYQRGEIV